MSSYQYLESGLSNVEIVGLTISTDDAGEEIYVIPHINELHMEIARGIVMHKSSIAGEELRFLRTEMGLSQAQLGKIVHRDGQSIGRWERNEIEIDDVSEALIRLLAIERLDLNIELTIEEATSRSTTSAINQPITIEHDDGHYRLAA